MATRIWTPNDAPNGIHLLPELHAHLNPMPYEAAAQKGFGGRPAPGRLSVTGGH
jgi:hypothetical protein